MQSFLSGDSFPEVWEHIRQMAPTSFINSCKLWPVVTMFGFVFIDAQHRSILTGHIAIGWQTYLSYLNRKADKDSGWRPPHPQKPRLYVLGGRILADYS